MDKIPALDLESAGQREDVGTYRLTILLAMRDWVMNSRRFSSLTCPTLLGFVKNSIFLFLGRTQIGNI
jgi:hypothetical protein